MKLSQLLLLSLCSTGWSAFAQQTDFAPTDKHETVVAADRADDASWKIEKLAGVKIYHDLKGHSAWIKAPLQMGCMLYSPKAICDSFNRMPEFAAANKKAKSKWRVAGFKDYAKGATLMDKIAFDESGDIGSEVFSNALENKKTSEALDRVVAIMMDVVATNKGLMKLAATNAAQEMQDCKANQERVAKSIEANRALGMPKMAEPEMVYCIREDR